MSLLLLLAPLAVAQDPAILMLGNSYTAYNELPVVVEDTLEPGVPAWDDVLVDGLYQGGLRLADHLARADGTDGDTPWREALVTGDTRWDTVVLQEQSQIPGFDETSPDLVESWEAAAGLDALIAAQGGETVFLMTWGRRDGDSQNAHLYPDFSAMQARLASGYLGYAAQLSTPERPVWVIPAGLAWQTVHDDLVDAGVDPTVGDTLFTRLYVADGSHPSLQGSLLVAATTLAALTGRSPQGLEGPAGIDPTELAELQDAAARTVLDDPFGDVAYPWAWTWTDWAAAAEDPQTVQQGALRPWVQLRSFGVTLTGLTIGDGRVQVVEGAGLGVFGPVVVGQGGPGSLWLDGGGTLIDELVLGSDDGSGDVRLSGGTLGVEVLRWAGAGTFAMTGGELIAGTIHGDLDQQGGQLVAGNPVHIDGDWTLGAGSSLLLEGPSGTVVVTGTAVLEGTADVDNGTVANADEVVLVDAASIDATALDVTPPGTWTIALRDGGLGQQLVLVPPGGSPTDAGSTDDTGEPGEGAERCGCAAAGGAAGAWLLLVPWWRRRR